MSNVAEDCKIFLEKADLDLLGPVKTGINYMGQTVNNYRQNKWWAKHRVTDELVMVCLDRLPFGLEIET